VAASVPATSTVDLARARELAGDAAGAAATLEPYVAAHPDDASAGLLLGDLYVRTGDQRRAEPAWKRVLDAHPGDRTAHARPGGLDTAAGRVEDAARKYAADMPSSPRRTPSWRCTSAWVTSAGSRTRPRISPSAIASTPPIS
jgi:predicted Zn-dependent protease